MSTKLALPAAYPKHRPGPKVAGNVTGTFAGRQAGAVIGPELHQFATGPTDRGATVRPGPINRIDNDAISVLHRGSFGAASVSDLIFDGH